MRGRHDNHGASPGNLPRSAGVDFSEEEVDKHGEDPQDEVIQPPDQGRDVGLLLHHAGQRGRRLGAGWLCYLYTPQFSASRAVRLSGKAPYGG